ncbi:MAG: hypothetical protein RIQ47_897 [Bacteroidota bacterium]|jgi:hypothetical protein
MAVINNAGRSEGHSLTKRSRFSKENINGIRMDPMFNSKYVYFSTVINTGVFSAQIPLLQCKGAV